MLPFGVSAAAPELVRRVALILAGLGALVARRFVRMPHLMKFTLLLWGRLNRAVRRLERALTRPARVRAARPGQRDRVRAPVLSLPMGRGWIVRELGWEAAAFMSQLEALLGELETRAALARAPGAGRVLRPICRMLGVAADVPPVVVRAPRVRVRRVARREGLPKLAKGAWFAVPGKNWGSGG